MVSRVSKVVFTVSLLLTMTCVTFALVQKGLPLTKGSEELGDPTKVRKELDAEKKTTPEVVLELIEFCHKNDVKINELLLNLKEFGHDYSDFYDKLISMYIDDEISLDKEDISNIRCSQFGSNFWAFGDLLFESDFSKDGFDNEDNLNNFQKILFDKNIAENEKKYLLQKNRPGIEKFFLRAREVGFTNSNIISYLKFRTFEDSK